MKIETEAYPIPENHKLLFLPTKKGTLFSGIQKGSIENSGLEGVTFSLDLAKKRLSRLIPEKGSLAVDTPLILVFQDGYGRRLPTDKLPIDQYVALLYTMGDTHNSEAFAVEMEAALEQSIGVDALGGYAKARAVFSRATMLPTDAYEPDISEKKEIYNSIVSFCQRRWGDPKHLDGELISNAIVSRIENLVAMSDFSNDATFEEKWRYVTQNSPEEIPDKEQRAELVQEQIETSKTNLMMIETALQYVWARHGLTSNESGLLNGMKLLNRTYRQADGFEELADLLTGDKIITPERLGAAMKKINLDYSRFKL